MYEVAYITSAIVGSLYFFMISAFIWGFLNSKTKNKPQPNSNINYHSIVIAVRNEEENITELLSSLQNQTLAAKYYEIILVDDHSNDSTAVLIKNAVSENKNIRFFRLPKNKTGKKAAISYGVKKARHSLITFTDADCRPTKNFLKQITEHYNKTGSKLILGPVILNDTNFFSSFQSAEYMSLTAVAAGSAGIYHSVLSNGANMTIEKKSFGNLNSKYASGDDMFLLHKIKKTCKKDISYIRSKKATIKTEAAPNIKSFLNQRIRWASKFTGYNDIDTIVVGLLVFAVNLLIILFAFAGIFRSDLFILSALLLAVKSIADIIQEFFILKFFKKTHLLPYFLLWIPLYPFYSLWIGSAGIFGKTFLWKGRNFSNHK